MRLSRRVSRHLGHGHFSDLKAARRLCLISCRFCTPKRPAFPSILSLDEAKQRSRELASRAIEAIQGFDQKADPLREIAHYVVERRE